MPQFDISRFLALAGPVQIDDLDLDEVRQIGIPADEARMLRYIADTETHTIIYLRDLLAGHTAHDAEVTSFLSVWVYEELWHGRAIDILLAAGGHPPPKDTYSRVTKNVSWREPIEALGSQLLASLTPRFAAAHMAWGAINELLAAATYRQLEERTQCKPLATLLGRIRKQERKHYAFYAAQAHKRLEHDVWAQRLCTTVLRAAWTPVGSGVGQAGTMHFIAQSLFACSEGQALLGDIDRQIRALPGLAWFDLVSRRVGAIVATSQSHALPPSTTKRQAARIVETRGVPQSKRSRGRTQADASAGAALS